MGTDLIPFTNGTLKLSLHDTRHPRIPWDSILHFGALQLGFLVLNIFPT